MRENLQVEVVYDGVDLARVAPAAWMVTLVLGWLSNHLAAQGYDLSHTRLQSIMLLTVFIGLLALCGTTQILHRMRDAGRTRSMILLAFSVLLCSIGFVIHGLSIYFAAR